jgi:branched-chain amino acid transport system substrate-binding protein
MLVSDLPMTGSSLGQTQTIKNAIKLALEERNYTACGGQWKIVYESHDDASAVLGKWDPDVVVANAKEYAANKNIVAVIGTFNSGAAKLMIPILNPENLVMVSPANTYPGLTKAPPDNYTGSGYGFSDGEPESYYPTGIRNYARVTTSDDHQGAVAAHWATELAVKTVYVLDDGDLYGTWIANAFETEASNLGTVVLGRETIDGKLDNYKVLATKITQLNPDMIYLGMITQNNAGQLIKDIRGSGYTGILMGPDGIYERALIEAAGDAAEGVYVTFGGLPADKMEGLAATWRDNYQAKYGDIEVYTVYGYIATQVILNAFDRVCAEGKPLTDRAAVRDAVMATKDFEGVLGMFSFDANGDTTSTLMSLAQVKGGDFVFVTTIGK